MQIAEIISALAVLVTALGKIYYDNRKFKKDIEQITAAHNDERERLNAEISTLKSSLQSSPHEDCMKLQSNLAKLFAEGGKVIGEATKSLDTISNEEVGDRIKAVLRSLQIRFELSRTYVAQFHPRDDATFVSVFYEANDDGVASVKDSICNILTTDYPVCLRQMRNEAFIFYKNIDEMQDLDALGIFKRNGTVMLAAKRMIDLNGKVVGSLVCEYMYRRPNLDVEILRSEMRKACIEIKNIIPDKV